MKKYYHLTSIDFSKIVACGSHEDADALAHEHGVNHYGPFDTFSEARQDAIEYHQCTKEHAQRAINELRATRKKEVDSEQESRH